MRSWSSSTVISSSRITGKLRSSTRSEGYVTSMSRKGGRCAPPTWRRKMRFSSPRTRVLALSVGAPPAGWWGRSYRGEEPGGRPFGAGDLVERGCELDAAARQRGQVGEALHDHHTGPQDHPVHREVLGREVGQTGAVLLEEVEADVLGPALHQPP